MERLMLLGGDIGGTKTNLALFERSGKTLKIKAEQKYPSHEHESLDEIVSDFLKHNPDSIEYAVFGIAGPVHFEQAKTTNLPWKIDAESLSKIIHGPVHLINDLEANAWGISALKEDEFQILQTGNPHATGNRALIAAGTGLGEAGLFYNENKHLPFACEGGHADFSPTNDLEIELLKYLMKQFGHASYERALSGQGLHNIYQFLLQYEKASPSKELAKEMQEKDPSYIISAHGLNNTDPLCCKALDLMVSLYGSAAGNLALKFMAYGGVYLGGGIAPKILKKLNSPLFIDAFSNKGRFSDLLKNITVRVILNDKAALLGAGQCALHRLK